MNRPGRGMVGRRARTAAESDGSALARRVPGAAPLERYDGWMTSER